MKTYIFKIQLLHAKRIIRVIEVPDAALFSKGDAPEQYPGYDKDD